MMLQGYAVANKGQPNEQRELVYFGESKDLAKNRIRDAIASGFEYGYVKQGFETVGYYTEKTFLRSVK